MLPRKNLLALGLCLIPGVLQAQQEPTLSFYGTTGMIDMPTGFAQPDAQLSFATSYFGPTLKNTLSFQITPRLSGSFRYSVIEDFDPTQATPTRYDRSFDLRYLLFEEGDLRPAVTVGIQDFGGTNTFGAEYVAVSKHFTPRFSGTIGIGWGRFGSYGGFTNPLGVLDSGFENRPGNTGNINTTGRLDIDKWFRGDAAFFGGVQWQATDKLSFTAEYSSDAYRIEVQRGIVDHDSPINLGAAYRFDNGWNLGAYYLYGSQAGVSLSYSFNPKSPKYPGGREGAPDPLQPRYTLAAASWGNDWPSQPEYQNTLRTQLEAGLSHEGIELEAFEASGTRATVHVHNKRFGIEAQAIGRTANVMANTLPPSVETFVVVPVVNGVPQSRLTLQRRDLEELEGELDGAWSSYVRTQIEDASGARLDPLPGVYPRFSYELKSYMRSSLFDPDNPFRADVGAELNLGYMPSPGVVLSGQIRQPIVGNLDEVTRVSNSILPHVRSDAGLYDIQSELEVMHLTGEYFFRPGNNLYGRLTAGYLEMMYGGVSGELLWKPVSGPLALGVELNYVKQRDFDMLFGFRNYDVVTGHLSAYYDFGNGFTGQVDAGRYLAGDWGATFSLDREFDNGFRVGAYFTLTDVSFSDFGEGSFDKGIHLTIPLSWLSGDPARRDYSTTITPVTRDGGARLNIRNRLYEVTRGYHDPMLRDSWGGFWR